MVIRCLSLLLFLLASVAYAGFDEGLAAARDGDYTVARREWQPLAESGDVRAQLNLGLLYAQGLGVAQDDKTAARWFQPAAEQGLAVAQYNLAILYAEGRGVGHDDGAALRWYRRAAEQGYAKALNNLGVMVHHGIGVNADPVLACALFELATDDEQAQANRKELVATMTSEEIGRAEALAAAWSPGKPLPETSRAAPTK